MKSGIDAVPLAVIGIATLCAAGCSLTGPPAISHGRPAYNEVLTRTSDEQYLSMIVRTRYAETVGLLSVASITAALRFSARIGGEAGVGSSASYAGNLVPLSVGVAYEENPTISYVPFDAQQYMLKLLSPVPAEPVLLLAGLQRHSAEVLELTVDRLGRLRNPLYGPEEDRAPFAQGVRMIQELQLAGVADFAQRGSEGSSYALFLHDYAPSHLDEVRRFLRLFALPDPPPDGRPVVVPIVSTISAEGRGIVLDTRSLVEVLQVAAACVEVPDEHHRAQLVDARLDDVRPPTDFLRIRSSEDRPDDASVAIHHRDTWFYIAADDARSKFSFQLVVALLSMQIAESPSQTGPMLTIPVGG